MSIAKELQNRFIYIFTYVTAGWLGASLMREYILAYTDNGVVPTLLAMAGLILVGYFLEKKLNGK